MLEAIVRNVVTTSDPNHPSGKRCVNLTLQNRTRGKFYASGVTPKKMTVEPGDQIELTSGGSGGKYVYFGHEEIRIIERGVIQRIEIVATISTVRSRKAQKHGGEWIAVSIDVHGFSSAAGIVPTDVKLERGMRCRFAGFPVVGPGGEPSLDFVYGGVTVLERETHNPILLAGRRAFSGFDDGHERKLRAELGDDWPKLLCKDPTLVHRPEFNRWRTSTKERIIKAATAIANMSPLRHDLLTVGVQDKVITKIIDGLKEPRLAAFREDRDAFHLVRTGHLSFVQARHANRLANYFRGGAVNRALAAIWDRLNEAKANGSSAVRVDDMRQCLDTQYALSIPVVKQAFDLLGAPISNVETIGEGGAAVIAFSEVADYERGILKIVVDMRGPVQHDLRPQSHKFDETQRAAIEVALVNSVSAVTGGPGTGKTTICQEIGAQLENVCGIALAARAARNLEERAGIPSTTIQRFLKLAHERRLAPAEALIVDEASMVGSKQMFAILKAARDAGIARVVLIGDSDQLPPIDWGRPFADLIASEAIPTTSLKRIYRTAEGGGIARLSADVREEKPLAERYEDVSFVDARGDATIADRAVREYVRLLKSGATFHDIGLLTPYSDPKFPIGSEALNAVIRRSLGKPHDCTTVGEIVIGTKNEYGDRYVLNGSRGVITKATGGLIIQFECSDEPAFYESNPSSTVGVNSSEVSY